MVVMVVGLTVTVMPPRQTRVQSSWASKWQTAARNMEWIEDQRKAALATLYSKLSSTSVFYCNCTPQQRERTPKLRGLMSLRARLAHVTSALFAYHNTAISSLR